MEHYHFCGFTLLWKRVRDAKVVFIVLGDVGGRLQGKVRLLQLVLRHRHLHRDVVRLRELLLRLEVADDESHQVGGHLLCHMELVPHLAISVRRRGEGLRKKGEKGA